MHVLLLVPWFRKNQLLQSRQCFVQPQERMPSGPCNCYNQYDGWLSSHDDQSPCPLLHCQHWRCWHRGKPEIEACNFSKQLIHLSKLCLHLSGPPMTSTISVADSGSTSNFFTVSTPSLIDNLPPNLLPFFTILVAWSCTPPPMRPNCTFQPYPSVHVTSVPLILIGQLCGVRWEVNTATFNSQLVSHVRASNAGVQTVAL